MYHSFISGPRTRIFMQL